MSIFFFLFFSGDLISTIRFLEKYSLNSFLSMHSWSPHIYTFLTVLQDRINKKKMTKYFGLFLIVIGTKFLYEYFNL